MVPVLPTLLHTHFHSPSIAHHHTHYFVISAEVSTTFLAFSFALLASFGRLALPSASHRRYSWERV